MDLKLVKLISSEVFQQPATDFEIGSLRTVPSFFLLLYYHSDHFKKRTIQRLL